MDSKKSENEIAKKNKQKNATDDMEQSYFLYHKVGYVSDVGILFVGCGAKHLNMAAPTSTGIDKALTGSC